MGISSKSPAAFTSSKNLEVIMAEVEATPAIEEAPAAELNVNNNAAEAPAAADPNVNNNATLKSGKKTKAAPAKKAAPKKAASAAAPKPKYSEMIGAAIKALKSRSGSSRQAIAKHITANHKECSAVALRNALKKGLAAGSLVLAKGVGAAGTYKLVKPVAAPKPKKVVKKVV